MKSTTAAAMPARDAARLRRAVTGFRDAGRTASRPLAAVVLGAHRAGWSYRTISRALGLSRDRTMLLASMESKPLEGIPPYAPGQDFPASAVSEFRRRSDRAALARARTEAKAGAVVRAAYEAGWSYALLAELAGLSDERLRQIAAAADEPATAFTPPPPAPAPQPSGPAARTLEKAEAARMRELAAVARTSTKNTGRSLGPGAAPEQLAAVEQSLRARRASEELTAMIIAARARNVPWAALDEACGYRPGSAKARAVRHGYGSLPPSRRAYRRHPAPPVDTSA